MTSQSAQIVVLDCILNPDNSFYLIGIFWLQAPANSIIPAPSFTSQVPNISVSDLSNLRAGLYTEQSFNTGSFPAGTTLATVQSFMTSAFTTQQAALSADNPPLNVILDGYTGSAWVNYNSTQNVASNILAYGTLSSLTSNVEITMSGSQSVGVQVAAGTFIGDIIAQTSFDGVTWNQTYFSQVGSGNKNAVLGYTSANTAGAYTIVMNGGVNYARVSVYSYTSGSCNITLTGSNIFDETLDLAIASPGTTNPPSLDIVGAYVTSSSPTYTTGLSNALSLTTAGALRVDATATVQPVSQNTSPWVDNITQIGGVSVAAVAKGTQATNAMGVQDFKDSGRVSFVAVASAVAGVTTEALISLTPVRTVTAGTAGTSLTVTSGKTMRLQGLTISVRNTSATQCGAIVRVRMNSTTVTVSSQEFYSVGATTFGATSGFVAQADIDFPDGFEISGTTQFGISQLASSTSCTLDVTLYGFEY